MPTQDHKFAIARIWPLTRHGKVWLGVILVLGLIVRLIASYIQPPFHDEAFVYYTTKAGLEQLIYVLKIDTHPPTFNLLLYPLIQNCDSIFILRLPQVIIAVFTLLLSFQLFRRYLSENSSLALTAILSLSYNIWLTEAQLRHYGPLTCCYLLIWLGMLDVYSSGRPFSSWFSSPSRWQWILFSASCILGGSLHVMGGISLFICAVCAWYMKGNAARWRTTGVLLVSLLPITLWFLWARLTCHFDFPPQPDLHGFSNWTVLLKTPLEIMGIELETSLALLSHSEQALVGTKITALNMALNTIFWGAFLLGNYRLCRLKSWEGIFLGANILIPLIAVTTASDLRLMSVMQTRYGLPYCAILLLFISYSCKDNFIDGAWKTFCLGVAVLMCCIFPTTPELWNQYWQSTVDFIDHQHRYNDLVAIYTPYCGYSWIWAYDKQHVDFRFHENYQAELIQRPTKEKCPVLLLEKNMLNAELLQDLKGYRVFLITCQTEGSEKAQILQWFQKYYRLVDGYRFQSLRQWANADTYVWEKKDGQ